MEKKRSPNDSLRLKPEKKLRSKNTTTKSKGCESPDSSSHTQFFKKTNCDGDYQKITKPEYIGISESISGSSATFHCVHGVDGKQYTEKGKLKRNLIKELDPVPVDHKWTAACAPICGWDVAKTLEFLVQDPVGNQQLDRLEAHIQDLSIIAENGYKIHILNSLCRIVEYLVETSSREPILRKSLVLLLKNMRKPILLNVASDVSSYFGVLENYIGFLGLLIMRLEENELFDMVSDAILWQLSAPDGSRGEGAAHLRVVLAAAAPVLYQTTARMLALASSHRFPTFLKIAFLLACDSVHNCVLMMEENIIENIFYRFNPYFPETDLPVYDINPADPQDYKLKLGDSSMNMSTTLSLLLVLLNTTMGYLDEVPNRRLLLPSPDTYSQRCFVWAYCYECRARDHKHERNTMTVITSMLIYCFGDRLVGFSTTLMPDVMSLAVATEVLPTSNWLSVVVFGTSQLDVKFKKCLIHLSVDFLKVLPFNSFMVESQNWLLGLMYLLDPGLCYLRVRWPQNLYAEIRKTAMQALICALPLASSNLVQQYSLIRRIMWYIEWYSESPYELPVLYWCVRLLQVATAARDSPSRPRVVQDLFESHGIIILMNLCYTLLRQKLPPVERSQVIIALCLRLLTSAVEVNARLSCCVYPLIQWPSSITSLATNMLDVILDSFDKHLLISDRWLVSLLNFIWEAIIWKREYRNVFVSSNGIYKLLDLITLTRGPVQCIALAIVSDVARAGDAVGQLVTWRARLVASDAHPRVVNRGATIARLLASVFCDECHTTGMDLDENGIIQNMNSPLMSKDMRDEMSNPDFLEGNNQRTPKCLAAACMAGSRQSKVFALLHMLSEDLAYKVTLADETYNLYKHIKLSPKDEAILVLCSNYLTIKLNETWFETKIQSPGLLPQDENILDEFLHIGNGWAKQIKRQQEIVIEIANKKEIEEECSLYAFLGRVRLNTALDALRELRCIARSADRTRMTHAMIKDAVFAHHRRATAALNRGEAVLRTYEPPLDDQNVTGQYVKIFSIFPKDRTNPRDDVDLSN